MRSYLIEIINYIKITKMSTRTLLIVTGISGALAVGLGAFGAHALKDFLISNERLDTYETAVAYHFYHTLALLGIGIASHVFQFKQIKRAGLFISIGVLIFSGSLYILCLTNVGVLGAITPIGGVFLILGWLQLALAFYKMQPEPKE